MTPTNVRSSYTSASALPVKLYRDLELVRSISADGRILPRHLQVCPTNVCNLKCSWCSCSAREIRDALTEEQLRQLVCDMEDLGTRGVTITGGGEPLLHPFINGFINELFVAGIKIGLVSNGIELRRLDRALIKRIDWCRVSFSDTRNWSRGFENALEYLQDSGCRGLAFSYVLTNDVNALNLTQTVRHAVNHGFTHVRVVDDILNPSPAAMERARVILADSGMPLDRVIFQPRAQYTRGSRRCLISLLKSVVDASGYLQPCCGVQYRKLDGSRDFDLGARMGRAEELPEIIDQQRHFDGSGCDRCFYGGYNDALAALIDPVDHPEFV